MMTVLCRQVGKWMTTTRSVRSLRFFSTADSSGSDEPYVTVSSHTAVGSRTVWPDEIMGPFAPQDKRFQLPGNVGFDCHLGGMGKEERVVPTHSTVPDIFLVPSNTERHEFILAQFINEYQTRESSVWTPRVGKAEEYFTHCDVECSVHSCPELLKHELESFFPALPVSTITVLTIKQKKPTIETELNTQELLHNFINGAKEICFLLWRVGYWADFIDPSSGSAYFSPQSHDPILRLNQRRHSGFHIEDVAACRLTVHVLTNPHTFAGTLITNAPSNSLIMQRLCGHTPT